MKASVALIALSLLGSSCGGDAAGNGAGRGSDEGCPGPAARFATAVISHEFGPGQDHGQAAFPAPVLGPPSGEGCCRGSLQVTSLGDGGFAVLEFGNTRILDGPGPDFIVFENAFLVDELDPASVFAELGVVSVSQDGASWASYTCEATAHPYDGCAGWHPVLANPETNQIDPLDPLLAGGDPFDLADVGLEWARYVRIEDRTEPDDDSATFDLDAVGIVHAGCP